jgi:S-adenosylmethionine hydrolase
VLPPHTPAHGMLMSPPRTSTKQEPAEQEPAEQEPAEQEPAEQEPAEQEPAEQEPAQRGPVITLLTDYGSGGLYVGLLHAVIESVAPGTTVIDLSHEVPGGDVLAGALALADALAFLPVGIHVAIVDPGVGTRRRALAVRCTDGRVLIGPDNGVLFLALAGAGGVQTAVEISASPMALAPVSATFHGRDIFAPVAAALAAGQDLNTAGAPIAEPYGLIEAELPAAELADGVLEATVTARDVYGNLALMARAEDASGAGLAPGAGVAVSAGERRHPARYASTFADVEAGALVLYEASTGRLALAVNRGSAAELLGVGAGARLAFRPVTAPTQLVSP